MKGANNPMGLMGLLVEQQNATRVRVEPHPLDTWKCRGLLVLDGFLVIFLALMVLL